MDIKHDIWKPVRVVGRKRVTPAACLPPLGDSWDKSMELAHALSTVKFHDAKFEGCIKVKSSKEGILHYG